MKTAILLTLIMSTVVTAQLPSLEDVGSWFQNAFQQLQNTVNGFIQWLQQNNPVQYALNRFAQFIGYFIQWFFGAVSGFLQHTFFDPILNALRSAGNGIYNAITSMFNAFKNAIEYIIGLNTTAST